MSNPKPAKTKSPKTGKETKSTQPQPKQKRTVEVETIAGKRASSEEYVKRSNEAYRLQLLGKTTAEIASLFGLSTRQVREYLKSARDRQVDEIRRLDGQAGVLQQYRALNLIVDEALVAYEESKKAKKTKIAGVETKETSLGENGLGGTETRKKTSQREEERIGDGSHHDRAMRALKELRELLGLNAPEVKRLLIEDGPGNDLTNEDLRSLPAEELLRRYRAAIGVGADLG